MTVHKGKGQAFRTMKAAMLIATLAVFLAAGFHSDRVYAHGAVYEENMRSGSACSNSYRISKDDATCLSAWWDNTPDFDSGVALGSSLEPKIFVLDMVI